MSRYRKSIHQAIEEVGEWQPPTEPEVLVEEAPIPTETGRELLKKRIAHKKVEKKELKYHAMGDVFRGKLQKTTEHLKEALEIDDELDEAVKWEVKVTGLPVFYSDGRSKGAVRQMLRKLLKHPDDIQSINRVTSAELKKIRRGQIAGDEPGDEDEDKNPVGPSYNEEDEAAIMSLDHNEAPRKLKLTQQGLEAFKQSRDEVELDELSPELANRAYKGARKKRQQIFNKSDETDRIPNVKKQDRQAKKFAAYAAKKEGFEGPFTAAGSGSIAKQRQAKAGDENKSIEKQMADARKESISFQEDEWSTMWKNAAKEKPKMSFKQATAFVDEVGLDKKEKTNALKTAKKWLK